MSAAQDDDTRDGVWAPRFAPVAQIIPPNVFADMDVKVAAAVASGADVIDLAKGNPDAYPAEFIRDVAKSSVDDPLNARYTPFDGKPAFLQAAANWYRNVHGVELDWRSQLFAVEGAVDGLAGLFAILIDRGDAVAFADPYYPSYHCMSVMHGAEEILLPARAELGWLPDLDAVDESVWRRLRMLILNYPNNPTGAQAPASFFEHAVELAKRYGFLIVHDFAYTGLGVSDQQVSLLTVTGASDVSVEVDSLSKMYAMAGWRAGFVAGNRDVVARLKQYHYQMGSMVTGMIQDAGAAGKINKDDIYDLHLMTAKPFIYVFNVDDNELANKELQAKLAASVAPAPAVFLNAQFESDLTDLDEADAREMLEDAGLSESGLDQLARVGFDILGLQTFLTAGVKEVRAWQIHKGWTAPQAAGVIHTDFERGFIKADIVSYDDFVAAEGSMVKIKEEGKLRQEGRDYVMQDGDIVEFKFNVSK